MGDLGSILECVAKSGTLRWKNGHKHAEKVNYQQIEISQDHQDDFGWDSGRHSLHGGVSHALLMNNRRTKVLCGRCTSIFDSFENLPFENRYDQRRAFLRHNFGEDFCVIARYYKQAGSDVQRQQAVAGPLEGPVGLEELEKTLPINVMQLSARRG